MNLPHETQTVTHGNKAVNRGSSLPLQDHLQHHLTQAVPASGTRSSRCPNLLRPVLHSPALSPRWSLKGNSELSSEGTCPSAPGRPDALGAATIVQANLQRGPSHCTEIMLTHYNLPPPKSGKYENRTPDSFLFKVLNTCWALNIFTVVLNFLSCLHMLFPLANFTTSFYVKFESHFLRDIIHKFSKRFPKYLPCDLGNIT